MESAMDSRSSAAATATAAEDSAPLPLFPAALLSLPDLDRPPAIMETWELEAVAAALPAKKRRLRETFDRLAACSPTPLPFLWEDLDKYISSLQYSVTLRHRQLRELEKSNKPALAALAPAPVTGNGDTGQVPVLEKPRPDRDPARVVPAAVSAPPATDGDVVHELRALVKSKPVQAQPPPAPPAPAAAVSALPAAAPGVHVEEGRKRKASIQEAEEVHVAKRTEIQEDAAVKKTTSPSHDDSNGKESMPVPRGDEDENGLAAEVSTSTDATVQVDPVSKVTVLQPEELPGPATARDANATNRARAAGVANSTGLQRSRQPRPVPASGAAPAASAAAVAGRDLGKSKKRKLSSLEVEAASQKLDTQHAVREVERRHESSHDSVVTTKNIPSHRDGGEAKASPRRPGHCSGNGGGLPITAVGTATAQVDADPICKTAGGTRHEAPATTPPHASNATSQAVPVPPNHEVPVVEMEKIVQPEETLQVLKLKEDASMVAKKARHQTQAIIKFKSEEADKVSPLPLGCSSSGHAHADGAGAATAMPPQVAAAAGGATVRKSPPAMTRDSPNLVQASAAPAQKSAGGMPAATRDAASASHAGRRAALAADSGSQQDGSDTSPVPPRGSNGLVQSSRVSAGTGTQAVSARDSAGVPQGSAAAGMAPAPARRDRSATNPVPASRREHTGPSEASAAPNAGKHTHVLQQQHMPKHEPISSPKKQKEWSSKNHGGRSTGSRPVPEAQDAAAQRSSWSRPGEGRGGGTAAARSGDDNNRNKDSFKGKRLLFCDNCGCKDHLAENCRTAKHLVALYQKAKEKEQKQICFRCGCTGHWSYNCRTAKHLVDLYQKDRAAKRAARLLHQE